MLTVVLEGLRGALVLPGRVSEEVGVGSNLSKHGSISQDFLLNTFDFVCETVVNDLVDIIVLSALVFRERVRGALLLFLLFFSFDF